MSHTNKKKNPRRWLLAVLIILIAAGMAGAMYVALGPDAPSAPAKQPQTIQTTAPVQTQPAQTVRVELEELAPINLGYGLEITEIGSYTGAYMEDGSDDVVSGVMMIVVRNGGDADLQFGRIRLAFPEETYTFELTNLPAGSQAVLLEQQRHEKPEIEPVSAILEEQVFFSEPMRLCEDQIGLSPLDGMLNVTNISGEDIAGDIYVYYKYASSDLFYGGITFRVRVEGGLRAGELRQVPAVHLDPDGCTIVQVVIVE